MSSSTVRKTYSLQEDDLIKMNELVRKAQPIEMTANNSFILRAALIALSELSDKQFQNIIKQVPVITTGRKKQSSV